MKKLHFILLATIPSSLFLFLLGCGEDHAGDDHSPFGHEVAHDGKSKTQAELLSMFEKNDSPHGEASVHDSVKANRGSQEPFSAHQETTPDHLEAEALLGGHSPVVGEPAVGAGHEDNSEHEEVTTKTSETIVEEAHLLASKTASPPLGGKLEDIARELDASKRKFEEQIDVLLHKLEERDDSVYTLKRINQQLRDQISQLRRAETKQIENLPIGGEIQALRDELLKLKNSFTLKVKEVGELREYNNQLLERLDALDPNIIGTSPNPPPIAQVVSGPLPELETPVDETESELAAFPVVAPEGVSAKGIGLDLASGSSLEFDAVVSAANGKIKEAFYTEFFVAKSSLREILDSESITLEQYKEVSTHAELWAQSRKSPFRYPDLQKKIRKVLLDAVDNEKTLGRRIRTDINGNSGEIQALVPGRYYIIGTASLGKVGVTWSVPVRVKSGHNKLSLTIANASWSL